ncbi:MAG: STAS domain-containing protein, partial [Bacteroidota bacterium]
IKHINDVKVVSFKPEIRSLNLSVAQNFKNQVTALMTGAPAKVLINFDGIKYVDSTGIAALISLLKLSRTGNGQLKISNMNKDVFELVKLMQLHNIFDISKDQRDALKKFV